MKLLPLAFFLLLSAGTASALPPAVELDRLMLHAKSALNAKAYKEAAKQLSQAQKLGIALPESFALDYATALSGLGKKDEAKQVVDKYFTKYGTKGASYKAVLTLLVQIEDQDNSRYEPSSPSASAAGTTPDWGLSEQDFSILIGMDIMKKVRMTERRNDILAAAEKGDMVSQYLIGASYEYGVGVDKDPVQKVAWLTKAANQGLYRAWAALGMARINGSGIPQDDITGWAWLLKSANAGNAAAQYNAAMLTLRGRDSGGGVIQYHYISKPNALAMLRNSAEAGLSVSQYALGHSYMVGTEENPKDLNMARYWLQKAAAQNLEVAAEDLATLR